MCDAGSVSPDIADKYDPKWGRERRGRRFPRVTDTSGVFTRGYVL